jgi:uncharacterized repeat protein (TIGR01451 family)
MKKIMTLLRYVPKKLVPVLALVAAVAVPVAIMAWGPDRATFTIAHPADHVTFNSITDNPNVGDERNFLHIKPTGTDNSAYSSTATLEPGKEYDVYVYYHNNAATSLNASGVGVAQGAYVKTQIPAIVNGSAVLNGFVGASNASPKEVWDDVTLKSNGSVTVSLVSGSATIHSNGAVNGKTLPDSIATSGASLGYDSLNGVLPGCFQYSGYVTYKIKVNQPNFTMDKLVSKHGENKWVDNYAAQAGETVDYLINYQNSGTTQQDNVTMIDTLPAGMSYVAGSSILGNSKQPAGAKAIDGVTSTGVNIGSYASKGTAWMIFSAKIAANDALPTCGANTLRNTAQVSTENGAKNDTADVTVNKTCVQPPQYTCDGLGVSKLSDKQFSFKASSTVKNANFVKYIYTVKDANGKTVKTIESTNQNAVSYETTTVGTYTVEAVVVVTVNGKQMTSPVGGCKGTFEVAKPPVKNIYTCESLTIAPVANTTDNFNLTVTPHAEGNVSVKEYAFDFGDGSSVKTVSVGAETQQHTYKPGTYTARVSVSFTVDGKTVSGITSDKCKVQVTVPQTPPAECQPGIPVSDARCTPTTPPSIPSTGPEAAFAGVLGSSVLGMGITSWVRSRRSLKNLR